MAYISYAKINSLGEIAIIGGNEITLEFNVYEPDGVTPVDLSGASVRWQVSPYGEPSYGIIDSPGTITGTNKFEITLTADETRFLSGKYIHQPVITSFLGSEYRPSQGVLLIIDSVLVT